MSDLSTQPIMYLPGVGPKRADLLQKELKIASFEDLIYYFPYKYVDRSKIYTLSEVHAQMPYIQVKGRFNSMQTIGNGRQQRLVATFTDGTGFIELIWFKGIAQIKEQIDSSSEYLLFGKPSHFNGVINLVHPEMEKLKDGRSMYPGTLQAFYNTTEKMKGSYLHSKAMQKIIFTVFGAFQGKISETLPSFFLQQHHLMPLHDALSAIHFPADVAQLEKARFRLKLEELFYIQLNILRLRNQRTRHTAGFVFERVGDIFMHFYRHFRPFELTQAQQRVIREIRRDLGSGRQMNRLLQGDVGSGKTLVALMVMLLALDNSYQACLMAPTEILANQHFENLTQMLGNMPVKLGLLTGSTKKKERQQLHEQLQNGTLHLLIGTHALLEETVKFHNLGLVVIDEQHRFGVAQRARLWKKNVHPPHMLVMTATPIPRTLAMTIYGDLDVSVIDELPPGRKPIQTEHYFHQKRNSLNRFVRAEIEKGRQVYVVYPLIEESESIDFKNLTEGYGYMQSAFPEFTTCMVHGKMSPAEKDEAMHRFSAGEAHIMVATTVIEVGVNVPNASVMVIESAERFGLSQLHQLRGRVGRGAEQSYCILLTGHKMSDDTRKRMEIMVRTTDGFEIAEADLKLRGPGDLEGTQQSGLPFALKIANLSQDGRLLQYAREIANQILQDDPLLEQHENQIFTKQLTKLARQKMNWSMIS